MSHPRAIVVAELRRRRETRKRWAEHSRSRYEVAPIDGLRVIVERVSKVWFVTVDGGMLAFGPEALGSSGISDAKAEALERVDRLLLNLRIAIGDVMR